MFAKAIEIRNYRRFEHYQCGFDSRFTLLAGPNGVGKSSLLMALVTGLGPLLQRLGVSRLITEEDVRRTDAIDPGGSRWQTPNYPCEISLQIDVDGDGLTLVSERNPTGIPVLPTNPELMQLAAQAIHRIGEKAAEWMSPTSFTSAPLIAHFGAAGRVQGAATPRQVKPVFEQKQQIYQRVHDDGLDSDLLAQWFQYNELRTLQEGASPVAYRVARDAVLSAIHATDIRYIVRDNRLMVSHPGEGWRPFNQLSDGQKRVAAIFCELALRSSALNSHLGEDALIETTGVVCIDELDLHLHPIWQRSVVADLCRIFPKVQFVVASHSPFLLQAAYEFGQVLDVVTGQFSEPTDHSVEDIAESVMGVDQPQRGRRFLELKRRAQEFYELLESQPSTPEARAALKARLDESLSHFANDPAAAALLEQRRIASGL